MSQAQSAADGQAIGGSIGSVGSPSGLSFVQIVAIAAAVIVGLVIWLKMRKGK